ncbi:CYFA0S15e02740g1_1 [Cyberlindnera fabianii]|uniref:CYFA0S15e02740g1_1 n=2 Tax=Cyberlindnera fabianii TaxID=36022 RepID=A0A061BCW7_CYBFA|nr:CYFA0S15e02740g1_1 [Cyberlindnera fabianii]
MSYAPLNNPPAYSDNADELPARDEIPDDFKYDTVVSGCELSIRQQFIRKVYTLLFAQLALTTGIGGLLCSNDSVKEWCLDNTWLFFVSIVGSIGFMIAAYIQSKKYPVNLILLAGFTMCEGYMIGVATSLSDTGIVLEAFGITLILFLGLTLFAFQSKYDFTSWVGVLNCALWGLISIGFIWFFFKPSSTTELVYSSIGAIVFSGYILVDTQLVMRKFNIEEEVPAAITLYLDVINLFLNILRILATQRDD